MISRMLPAGLLSLSCLALAGCGAPAGTTTEAPAGPLSDADLAEYNAEMERVADEERAYQDQEAAAAKAR